MRALALPLIAFAGCSTQTLTTDGGADAAHPAADLASAGDAAASADLATADLAMPAGADLAGANSFPDALPGIWLIGWSGGLEHYSWARFHGGGAVDVLPPM